MGIPTIQPGVSPAPIIIPTDMMNAKAINNISMTVNLDSEKEVISATGPTAFSPTGNKTYSYSSSVTAFDNLGNERAMNVYFVKPSANTGATAPVLQTDIQWHVYMVDPSKIVPTAPSLSLNFNQNGQLNLGTAASPLAANFNYDFAAHNGSAANVINFNFAGSRQQRLSESNIYHIEKWLSGW